MGTDRIIDFLLKKVFKPPIMLKYVGTDQVPFEKYLHFQTLKDRISV